MARKTIINKLFKTKVMYKNNYGSAAPMSKYAAKRFNRYQQRVAERSTTPVANNGDEERVWKSKTDLLKEKYGEHTIELASIVINNAEIRRFTAIGILNYLLQKGEINGEKRYVSFKWNKFSVNCDGLARDYFYTEPFFINALVASFTSFSASAQRVIDNFCRKEMSVGINKAASQEDVDNIVQMNEEYQEKKKGETETTDVVEQ